MVAMLWHVLRYANGISFRWFIPHWGVRSLYDGGCGHSWRLLELATHLSATGVQTEQSTVLACAVAG